MLELALEVVSGWGGAGEQSGHFADGTMLSPMG